MTISYPTSATSDDRRVLDSYVRFLRMADASADQNDHEHPEIDARTVDPVKAKTD